MKRFLPHIVLTLFVAQLLLMVGSWLYSAAYPMSGVRSMLSGEGLRWFLGHFADMLATPQLVYILLLSMGYGTLRHSGIRSALSPLRGGVRRLLAYREQRALTITLLLLAVYVVVVLLLTAVPHALLLSATGRLWPSPFSASLVPLVAFGMVVAGVVYGVVAGRYVTLSDVCCALLKGLEAGTPWLLLYVLAAQLYESLLYVIA